MTIEKLLNSSSDELGKLDKKELYAYFDQFLKVTRPDLAEKPNKVNGKKKSMADEHMSKKEIAKQMALKMGIDIDW